MQKKRRDNSGFTIVELVVSIAILAFIIIAISGVMSSNNLIFRKVKSDIDIQNIAQDTESKIANDVMQAKFIYIKGKATDTEIQFNPNDPGKDPLNGTIPSTTDINLANYSDIYLLDSSDYDYNDLQSDPDFLKMSDVMFANKVSTLSNTIATGSIHSPLDQFNLFYNKVCSMSNSERIMYKEYLSEVDALGTVTGYADSSLKSVNASGSTKYKYKYIYVSEMVVFYQIPLDKKYCPDYDLVDEKDRYVYCKVHYEVENNNLNVTVSYEPNSNISATVWNGSAYGSLGSNELYTDCLNYVSQSSGGATTSITGFMVNVDSENNALNMKLNFVKNKMRYNTETVIQFRNTYVINDAN